MESFRPGASSQSLFPEDLPAWIPRLVHRFFNRADRVWLAQFLIAIVAVIDWRLDVDVAFGFLYLLPILLLGTVWRQWQVLAIAVVCTLLADLFEESDRIFLIEVARDIVLFTSLAGSGLFAFEVSNSRRREREAQREIGFLATLLCNVNDAVVGLDSDFKIKYWNKAAARLFEWSVGEVLGKTYSVVVHSALSEPERQRIHEEIFERGQWRGELLCHRRSGDPIILEVSASVFSNGPGSETGVVCIHHDVTSRRRTEAALVASENRFKLAESALDIGTWDLDLKAGRSTCSGQLLRLYGIMESRMGFTEEEWIQHVHPDDRERMLAEVRASAASGIASDRHYRTVWPDGTVRWMLSKSHVVLDSNGRPARIIGADFDETEQVHAKERLRFLSSAVEQSPVSIVITDLHGNIEYVNRKTTEITGYSFEELKGRNPRLLKSGETPPEEYRALWETIQTGEWRGTFHNRKKNGEFFWESVTISPIRDSSGKPTHYLAVKEDITQRREVEMALKTSDERFRLLTDTISEVFWMSDGRLQRILYISPAYEKLWERSRESLYADPTSFMEPIHPDDLDRARDRIVSGMASQRPFDNEYRIVGRDGSIRHIRDRGFPVFDASGGMSCYVGVARDVSAQKASEMANAELAAIVHSADSAIISKDLHGNVLTWNAGAERIFGYSASEMIGRNIRDLIPGGHIDEEARIQANFLRGEATEHLETVRLTKSGNAISVLLTISPIRDHSNTVVGAAQVAWDITDQKLLQRQLANAQKLESIGQLAAGIAHEINTPIQYVGDNAKFLEEAFRDLARFVSPQRELAEMLRRSQEPGLAAMLDQLLEEVDVDYLLEETPKAIQQLSEGVEQVARIVRAMKEFSHPGPVEKVPLDINRAIESTVLVSKNEWKYVADLTTDFDLDLPLVPCVAGEFNQVVLNLIVNAAHAIADVTKATRGKGAIQISTRRRGGWAEVRVRDTGTGIPEAIQAKVFDPFFTTKEVGKGTGQGLSIAHAVIVQKHHGTLRFESEPGAGTTFILQLPLEGQYISDDPGIRAALTVPEKVG